MTNPYTSDFVPCEGIYLLNHSVGRPPVSSQTAYIEGFLDPWKTAGEEVWPRWLESIESFRNGLAQLLNGEPGSFCPQANLSSALTKILQSLPAQDSRRTIVYTEHDFPSMAFVLQQAQRTGFQLRAIPAGVDTADTAHWADHLGDDVAFLLVTHVHSNTGKQVPVAGITALARERGIVSIVDIAQSVGCVPIDLTDWSADFVIGSCVKWLCGGPGAGFLWVAASKIADCEPTDVGWFSHENPFEFDMHNFRYASDALRFWGGTPSVQPYVTAANSIALLNDIGIETVRQHNMALTQSLADAVDPAWLVSPALPQSRGGTLVLNPGDALQAAVCTRLRRAAVLFDERPTGIRLSPHIYNTEEELAIVRDCLSP